MRCSTQRQPFLLPEFEFVRPGVDVAGVTDKPCCVLGRRLRLVDLARDFANLGRRVANVGVDFLAAFGGHGSTSPMSRSTSAFGMRFQTGSTARPGLRFARSSTASNPRPKVTKSKHSPWSLALWSGSA